MICVLTVSTRLRGLGMNDATKTRLRERYLKALHAMQAGVAIMMQRDPDSTSPKHLRVGVNSSFVEHAALARVLIDKGAISDEEYSRALCEEMENEVAAYETRIAESMGKTGTKIKLV